VNVKSVEKEARRVREEDIPGNKERNSGGRGKGGRKVSPGDLKQTCLRGAMIKTV
jgi:hypothetical protein